MACWKKTVLCVIVFIFSTAINLIDSDVPGCPKCDYGSCKALNFPARITSNRYYLHTVVKLGWFKAHQFCLVHGMRLATIENEEQNDELIELMERNKIYQVWIGVTDHGEDNKFYSVHNGSSQRYTNWLPGQPDDNAQGHKEPCVLYMKDVQGNIGWNDAYCAWDYYFACDLAP